MTADRRTIVVDASAALFAAADPAGFEPFAEIRLVAPPLLWSEATSALHALAWRGVVGRELAEATLGALQRAPIEPRAPDGLHDEAWRTADRLGWAKTYDAEYVALALVLDCPLLTSDARLARRVQGVVEVAVPETFAGRKG